MRISDWSSDVCSSDLALAKMHAIPVEAFAGTEAGDPQTPRAIALDSYERNYQLLEKRDAVDAMIEFFTLWLRRNVPDRSERRSEERRVGKECVSTCRSRG